MTRHEILLVLCGAYGTLLLLLCWEGVRALVRRRKRRRLLAESWRTRIPMNEHPALAEIRHEADVSHRRYLRRLAAEEKMRQIREDWITDGEITLTSRKKPSAAA